MSEVPSLRKLSSPKVVLESNRSKQHLKRIHHIKSLPALQTEPIKLNSPSKLSVPIREETQSKIKGHLKNVPHIRGPLFGTVKTARERNIEWSKKKEHHNRPSLSSKSLSKSTNLRSPRQADTASSKRIKAKSKGGKAYSGILKRMNEVMEDYQLVIEQLTTEKESILKQNRKLKGQLQGRRSKKTLH